ncbi:hypothetical protein M8J77_010950 [Diaphorina citri]|nr:hypothetical protein M8J77_010950 [Diaphorina citri]
MRWMGHVLRRDDESLIKSVWEGELTGTRRRGRPKLRWKDQIKRDMAKINTMEEDAQDRTVWRGKIGEAKSLLGFKWPWHLAAGMVIPSASTADGSPSKLTRLAIDRHCINSQGRLCTLHSATIYPPTHMDLTQSKWGRDGQQHAIDQILVTHPHTKRKVA